MGVIYKAHHSTLNKPVAVKVLHDRLLGEEQYVARFMGEAQAAAKLEHQNVVQILNAGTEGDLHFIVMQLVDGEDLRARLRRETRLGVPEALRIAGEVAKALSAAHELGLVHRDIKPENVMLTAMGEVKVADFGLAKDLLASLRLTSDGKAVGTPYYMAPEQFSGEDIDQRTDLYGLGVLLYEMVSGTVPFTGKNQWEILRLHQSAEPEPLSERVPGVTAQLDVLISKLMAKAPKDRYQRADDVADALAQLAELEPSEDPGPVDEVRPTPATGAVSEYAHKEVARDVEELLERAVAEGASAVHIGSEGEAYRVRFRIGGLLTEEGTLAPEGGAAVTGRLKFLGGLDPQEELRPQDGRFVMEADGHDVTFKLSSMPGVAGDTCVLSVLDASPTLRRLDRLGLQRDVLNRLRSAVEQRQGLVVASGLADSGVSTTLSALVMEAGDQGRAAYSIEDPVESFLPGVKQIPVNVKRGQTPAACFMSALGQDADVIMVSAALDGETVGMMVKAALSGRLILACQRAKSIPEALGQLEDMGAQRQSLATSLTCISGQVLVRRLCSACKEERQLPVDELVRIGFTYEEAKDTKLFEPVGCERCRDGYRGRLLLAEVMTVSANIREMVAVGAFSEIRDAAGREGMVPLGRYGIGEAIAGRTSVEEILSVTQANG